MSPQRFKKWNRRSCTRLVYIGFSKLFPSYTKVQLAKYQTITPSEPVANPQPPLRPSASDILGLGSLGVSRDRTHERTLVVEAESYINDPSTGTTTLNFWQVWVSRIFTCASADVFYQENQLRYPTLFRLAMDILPIQGSSVPCERVFSSAKETMTDRRNQISPELMEALQLLKFSLRQGHFLDFSVGTSWDAELAATEAAHYATMPDDLDSFIAALNRHI